MRGLGMICTFGDWDTARLEWMGLGVLASTAFFSPWTLFDSLLGATIGQLLGELMGAAGCGSMDS